MRQKQRNLLGSHDDDNWFYPFQGFFENRMELWKIHELGNHDIFSQKQCLRKNVYCVNTCYTWQQ